MRLHPDASGELSRLSGVRASLPPMIGGGRSRRRGRTPALLPSSAAARSSEHSFSSCWYCDCKIFAFNDFLFNLGWKYARFIRVWFSLGVYFSLFALVGVSMIVLWDSIGALYFGGGSFTVLLQNILASGFSISIIDTTIIVVSTMLSIAFHEFGHAIAAASEGLQIEYVAIFLAVLFPGALVALNYDLLQNLPPFSMLRIFCAGIWHNVMLCAVCVLIMLLLPLALYPLYVHGEGLMVMGVSQTSPLAGYLSVQDVIVSVDGLNVTRTDEWIKMMAQGNERIRYSDSLKGSRSYEATSSGKGYCVPNSWIDASRNLWQINDKLACPDELMTSKIMSCNESATSAANTGGSVGQRDVNNRYCLIAKDVVKLRKCGYGWQRAKTDGSNCACLEDEYCLVPVLTPGTSWIEISYSRPYSLECLQKSENLSSSDAKNNNLGLKPCAGTFVYAGDLLSAAHSIKLSSYQPRWTLLFFIAGIPYILENAIICMLHISAVLAVVNCLPVYFLDGEAILETGLCYIPWFTKRQQRKIFNICRFLWTVTSIIMFSRILYSMTLYFRLYNGSI